MGGIVVVIPPTYNPAVKVPHAPAPPVPAGAGSQEAALRPDFFTRRYRLTFTAAEQAAGTAADEFRLARVADAWKYYRTFLLGRLKFTLPHEMIFCEAA